jgi:DNA-binding GntR family transcriptional regulator
MNADGLTQEGEIALGGHREGAPRDRMGSRRGSLAPIRRETLHERVYAELRRSLIHGAFDAGEILRIVDLARTLQTSTMPVREALGRLVSEQALEAMPSRSVRVPLISRVRLDDLARARRLVEGELTALALPNLESADFAELKSLTIACESAFADDNADKTQVTSEFNHAFHFHIYQAARSAVLIPIVESLWLQSSPYVRAAARIHDQKNGPSALRYHWALIEALERGDRAAAIQALTDDVTYSFNLIRTRFDEEAGEGSISSHD